MKKALSVLIALSMVIMSMFCGLTAVAAPTTINVTTLGVVANDRSAAVANTTKLLTSMISAADNTTFYFPSGTYYISTSSLRGMYLSGKNDMTLLGDNATIVNASYDNTNKSSSNYAASCVLRAENCTNLTIKGLNIDYLDYTAACGTIVEKTGSSVTIELDDAYINGAEKPALTGNEFIQCIDELDANGAPIHEYFTSDETVGFAGSLSGNRYTISGSGWGDDYNTLTVGNRIVARFTLGTYACPPFSLTSINGLTVEDVNVYSCPSAVFYGTGANANFTFKNLNVAPKAGTPELFGANVDAIHVIGCSGKVNIENCSFIGMGDDALNVFSRAAKITAVNASANSVTCADAYDSANLSDTWCAAGDTIRFYKSDWTLVGTATVTKLSGTTMTFSSLPAGVTTACYMQNEKFIPSISITDTTVDGSRARAFMIRSEDVNITGCNIRNTRLSAIIVAADLTKWFEFGTADNVTISGNTFENCCAAANTANYGTIAIKGCDDGGGESFKAGVHKNITITGNNFDKDGSSAIYASAVDGLTVTDNTFGTYACNRPSSIATSDKAVAIVNCDNVTCDYTDSLYTKNVNFKKETPDPEPVDPTPGGSDDPVSEYDDELASIVLNNYDDSVAFNNDGNQNNAVNWTSNNDTTLMFNNWKGKNNRVNTAMTSNVSLTSKTAFDLSGGFAYQICTVFNPNADKFTSDVHYIKIGELKLVIDCGQNLAGSRTSGIYLYKSTADGDTLISSADTGAAANDSTFKSHYTANFTYYNIKYTADGKYTLSTTNNNGTYDVVWTLADGTADVSAVPVAADLTAANIDMYKFGGFAQYGSNDTTVLCDPALKAMFPYAKVSTFTSYLTSLNKNTTAEELARARNLYNTVNSLGSVGLIAAVAPYEKYIIAVEEGGDDGEEVTVDSGNMPSTFFKADSWSKDSRRLVYEMSDGSIKFDGDYSASIDKFVGSGFTVQFKAVGGWELALRNTSDGDNDGYILGYTQRTFTQGDDTRHLYIKRAGSDVELARAIASPCGYTENEWHTLGVYFDDVEGKTTIRVYIDGVKVNFGPGYTHENAASFTDKAIENGNLVDFAPIQRGMYIKARPYYTDYVSGYGTMSFRSVDATAKDHITTIACVGDSITQGACATGREYSYPAELQRILGTDKFNVVNFGRSGATLMNNTGDPYSIQNAYYRSINFAADYVVLMLGTNDSTTNYWERTWSEYASYDSPAAAKYEADLRSLISAYTALGSKVVLMAPPVSHNQYYCHIDDVIAVQRTVAADLGIDIIDLNAHTAAYGDNWADYYAPDGLHLNDAGYASAAQYVSEYFANIEQSADTEVVTPDKSDILALETTGNTSFNAEPNANDLRGFTFWYSQGNGITVYIGAAGAQAWGFSNAVYDLGKNFDIKFTVEHKTSAKVDYTAGADYTKAMYTSVQMGALEMRIRPLKNENGVKSFAYDLYMNGVNIGSSYIDSGDTAPADTLTYSIRFINGYINVTRSDNVEIMTVMPADYNTVRMVSDYAFNDARVGFGTFELGGYVRLKKLNVAKFDDNPVDYTISATAGGKIMNGDAEFVGDASYMVGDSITLTAVADDGYLFDGWYNGDDKLITKDVNYTVTFVPTTVVTARFISKTPSVTDITATTGGAVYSNDAEFDNSAVHYIGTSAVLTAVVTDPDYKFAYWKQDGKIVSYDTSYTVTFGETTNVVAVFASPLDQQLGKSLTTIKKGYKADEWIVTGDNAFISDGKIFAGNGNNQNSLKAVYNDTLDLSSGFKFTTLFTWAYGTDNGYNTNVNYWANDSYISIGDIKLRIVNSFGTNNKKPVMYELYNGATLIASYDTGYTATNGQYSTAIEEYLNTEFTISFDGKNVTVFSSKLDADKDGTAGELIKWTLANSTVSTDVPAGEVDLSKAVLTVSKNWGGANLKNVSYFADFSLDGRLPFYTVEEFDEYLLALNDTDDAAVVAQARAYYDVLTDDVKAALKNERALIIAEARVNGETLAGDVNGDWNVDASDLLAIQQHIIGLENIEKIAAADMDGDGFITAADLLILQLIVLGV